MASYTGIHVEHSDLETITSAIQQFESNIMNRKIRRIIPLEVDIQSIPSSKIGLFNRMFYINPAVDSWTEVIPSCSAWNLTELANYISAQLKCRCLVLGYQTTVGQTYYHVSENGKARRTLWYTKGDPVHQDIGERFDFERQYIEEQRKSLTADELEELDEMDDAVKETFFFPDCYRFAEGIGCKSFLGRPGEIISDGSKGISIKSIPKWWFLG
ncbi:MAG: hypothetical protein ACE14V_13590 [bacterium]